MLLRRHRLLAGLSQEALAERSGLSVRGISVAAPTPQTLARIKDATGVDVTPARIIDLTLAGAQYKVMKGALDVLLRGAEYSANCAGENEERIEFEK